MDLAEFTGPWWSIIYRYRIGDPIERRDILEALESEFPIPDAAKPLLHKVVSGYSFKRGNKPRELGAFTKMSMPDLVDAVEHLILSSNQDDIPKYIQDLKEDAKKQGETARTTAKKHISEQFNISERLLEKYITEARRRD